MRIRSRLVVLAAILAASCGGASGVATAPSPTPPSDGAIPWSPRLTSPTPTPVPTPPLAPCRVSDVTSSFDRWGAAAGSVAGSIRLAPTAAVCGIPAYPRFRFVTETNTLVVPASGVASGGDLIPIVAPAGKASSWLQLQWSGHGAEPGYRCASRSPLLFAVEIEIASGWLRLPFETAPITLCTDPIERVFLRVDAPEPPAAYRPEPIFDARIIGGPGGVRAGDRIRYLVQLTNRTATTQRSVECPAYIQNIAGPQELGSSDRPGFRYVERRQILNCAGVGDITPGATLTFEMYFDVPADVLPGAYVLVWRLDGPVYSSGTKVIFGVER